MRERVRKFDPSVAEIDPAQWREKFHCYGCEQRECPQCGRTDLSWLQLGPYDLGIMRFDTARFSHDETLRYTLTRELGPGERVLMSVGLNPSTATAFKLDPTVRRDKMFARVWGCDRLFKFNADAYRATKPADMKRAAKAGVDIVGPENDAWIRWGCKLVRETGGILWATWGANIDPQRQAELAYIFDEEHVEPMCWKTNDDGSPAHELYAPSEITLTTWRCP